MVKWFQYNALGAIFAAGSVAASGQGIAPPLDHEKRMILTQKDAVALMPAEVICGPVVQEMAFSDSGRYLLVTRQEMKFSQRTLAKSLATRQPPPMETSIVIWDSQSREVHMVWKSTGEGTRVDGINWLVGSDVALVLVEGRVPPAVQAAPGGPPVRAIMRQSLLRIVPGADRAQVIAGSDDVEKEALYLFVSPARPLAILQRSLVRPEQSPGERYSDRMQQMMTVIGSNGRLGKSYPAAPGYMVYQVEWDADGAPILNGFTRKGAEKPVKTRVLFDVKTGAIAATDKPAPPPVVRTPDRFTNVAGGIRLKPGGTVVKEGTTSLSVGTLWLEAIESTEQPRALVSADSTGGQLAPNGDAIVFQSQNTLMAVPLLHVDKAVLQAARDAAKRMELLSKGKQIALATLMYAQDYDEVLPNGDDLVSKLTPYAKDASIFDGLSYTLSGGPLKDIESPAETELGFLAGPGGRAVIYVDGHVKWKSDK